MFTLTKELFCKRQELGGGDYGRTLRSTMWPVPWCEIVHAHICRSNMTVTSRSRERCSSAVQVLQLLSSLQDSHLGLGTDVWTESSGALYSGSTDVVMLQVCSDPPTGLSGHLFK